MGTVQARIKIKNANFEFLMMKCEEAILLHPHLRLMGCRYLTATELNGTDVNGTDYHRFTGSPKYKIQAESSSASRCSIW